MLFQMLKVVGISNKVVGSVPQDILIQKQEAVQRARTISQNQNTELVVHNKDGRIAGKDSHGNDPIHQKDNVFSHIDCLEK